MNEKTIKSLIRLIAIYNIIKNNKDSAAEKSDLRKVLNNYFAVKKINELLLDYDRIFSEISKDVQDNLSRLIYIDTLEICKELNHSRSLFDKIIIAKHILDYTYKDNQSLAFTNTFLNIIFETLNIPTDLSRDIYHFGLREFDAVDPKSLLIISDELPDEEIGSSRIFNERIKGKIYLLYIKRFKVFLVLSDTNDYLLLNSKSINKQQIEVFNEGAVIQLENQSYFYGPVLKSFIGMDQHFKIELKAKDISYQHSKTEIALHPFSGSFESGNIYGILGSSGSGKTTLLNLLAGTTAPNKGEILINNIVLNEHNDLNHLIGFVPQQDLLLESLSVYQNLYFTAQLVHPALSENQIRRKCKDLMKNLGLYDVRHLKVGSKLEKVISGGQRKRLNIALELIREPKILFVDEPTTGLSSRDSEIVMRILKEHALNGNVVITVIHQPSSEIFKSFDQVLFLDEGYPVYLGNPQTALPYLNHISNDELSDHKLNCNSCAHINVEGVFDILFQQTVDKYGNFTGKRKISPVEWYQFFLDDAKSKPTVQNTLSWDLPKHLTSSKVRQFFIFFRRDYLSKIASFSYTVVNLAIAPILAIILAFIMKSYTSDRYTFANNDNIPSYFFIFIISALFLGLVLSAEEILKDRNVLRRERFLKLNWGAYVLSKLQMLFFISLIQAISFTTIGNFILEIKDFWFKSFLIYLSCALFANITGLILSTLIKSEKVIYITIPLLIIPQIILSGLLLPFDKTHPSLMEHEKTPFIADLVCSRWAYEAIITEQYSNNPYEKYYFENNCNLKTTLWYLDYWLDAQYKLLDNEDYCPQVNDNILEYLNIYNISDEQIVFLCHTNLAGNTKNALKMLEKHFKNENKKYSGLKNELDQQLLSNYGKNNIVELKKEYFNKQSKKLLTKIDEKEAHIIKNNRVIRKLDPIYNNQAINMFKSPFYTPYKSFFGFRMKTYWINIIFINLVSVLMLFTLTFQLGKKLRKLFKIKI